MSLSKKQHEGFAKFFEKPTRESLRSLIKDGKNNEVAQWFFNHNKNLNSSKYYVIAAEFYELAHKTDSAAISLNLALDNGMSDPKVIDKTGLKAIEQTDLWQTIKFKLDALSSRLGEIENFQIDVEPITSFNHYFNLAVNDTSQAKKLLSEFILSGSDATREFYADTYKSLEEMKRIMIIENPERYLSLEKITTDAKLDSMRKNLLEGMKKLNTLYPETVFPKVYLMAGILNSGGRSTELGLFVGTERFINEKDSSDEINYDAIKSIIMHELMHFQQGFGDKNNEENLIGKIISEGSCDFLRELCLGEEMQNDNLTYLQNPQNMSYVLNKLKKDLYKDDTNEWMYNYESENLPVDIGYTIGYLISKSYYQKSLDKKKSIYRLFNTTSFEAILAESDYGFLLEEKDTIRVNQNDRVKVTFTCESCKIKNKLKVSGPDEFVLTKIEFPIEKRLRPGVYKMTYWQNKVQQIHLPFTVKENSKNTVKVKD